MTRSGLRLMVYDDTDVATTLKRLSSLGSLPVGIDFLDIAVPVGLSHSWAVGGAAYKALSALDDYAGFDNWAQALRWLATTSPGRKISQIQYWGHGSPGKIWMNSTALGPGAFDGKYQGLLSAVSDRLDDEALVWFRTCATFGAVAGRQMARAWSRGLGCRVAGHCLNIGVFHGGLFSLRPGQEPAWSPGLGIKSGSPAEPREMVMSGPWWRQPHTITCLSGSFPRDW